VTKLLQFPEKKPEPPKDQCGKFLYDIYRQARVDQGWEEFLWESLSQPQQLVWARVTKRLSSMGMVSQD